MGPAHIPQSRWRTGKYQISANNIQVISGVSTHLDRGSVSTQEDRTTYPKSYVALYLPGIG